MTNSTSTWMGFDKENRPVQISHSKLMEWAYRNDQQIVVGWGHQFEINGQRLVRGEYVKQALKAGWDDIAHALANYFDECPGFHIADEDYSGCSRALHDCPTCGSSEIVKQYE